MKKTIAVLLCLMMLLSCAAMAEAPATEKESMGAVSVNGAFELKCAIPEGYALNVLTNESDNVFATVSSEADEKPMIFISIAYNDMYYGVERLNDLDEEAIAVITDTFMEDDTVEISKMTTAYGTDLLVIKENRDDTDYVDFYTVYKGYEIELVLTHVTPAEPGKEDEFTPVTDEEIQMAVQFLSDLDFVPETAEAPAE